MWYSASCLAKNKAFEFLVQRMDKEYGKKDNIKNCL